MSTAHTPPATPIDEIAALCQRAREAFTAQQRQPTFSAAGLLRAVAQALEDARAELVSIARQETALTEERLEGELTRTTAQLHAFSELEETGLELDAIIDTADATPPRPDQRRMSVPIGPVAVFAASNFPFAFSVAGGDTAAAWAAGCPVLLKAHPAHPETSALTAAAVSEATARTGAPETWFTAIYGATPDTGQAVVNAEPTEAVAFTGSFAAGSSIARTAAQRPRPIPAYCEMGSINPLIVTPAAARERAAEIAQAFAASITNSAGQLCTKPGLLLLVKDDAGRALAETLAQYLRKTAPAKMLYPELRHRFTKAITDAARDPRVQAVTHPDVDNERASPMLLTVAAATLTPRDPLLEEIFGPASIIVWAENEDELLRSVRLLSGTLTATVHAAPSDRLAEPLMQSLSARAGRLIYNGYPTGVTVGHATVHGGPHPATTNPFHTSVGMTAIRRFQRPVGYQNVPDHLLPRALQDSNPLRISRRVNGTVTAAEVSRMT